MNPDEKVTYFAETDSRNRHVRFGIKAKDRTRHVYVIGKTGMGKSTLLENMAIQDIQSGEGMAFIDPHGKTADLLLSYVPKERIKDVLYFAPFDIDHPISFNVMEDVGPERRHLVVNGLMSTFKKLFGEESFSDRMQYILQNTILALLEYPNSTMLGINRMLTDKVYRAKVVANVTDSSVKAYWTQEFAGYTDRFAAEATPAIQNKIGQFTSNPLIRNIIGQPKSSFDIRKMMDEKKILIVNLSKGRVGEANAALIGSMLVTKIYLAAMSRADASEMSLKKLPHFNLFVDEFQSFANESFADILSEARKYKLNLTIAHQYIEQMPEEVQAAVFGNVGTMVMFRVGAIDAELLEKEFAPQFMIEDLVNLGIFQIYLKLMIDGVSSRPFSAVTMPPIPPTDRSYIEDIIASSRAMFAKTREVVEEEIRTWQEPIVSEKPKIEGKSPASSAPSTASSLGVKSFSQAKPAFNKSPAPAPTPRSNIPARPQVSVISAQPVKEKTSAVIPPQSLPTSIKMPVVPVPPLDDEGEKEGFASLGDLLKVVPQTVAITPVILQPVPTNNDTKEEKKPSIQSATTASVPTIQKRVETSPKLAQQASPVTPEKKIEQRIDKPVFSPRPVISNSIPQKSVMVKGPSPEKNALKDALSKLIAQQPVKKEVESVEQAQQTKQSSQGATTPPVSPTVANASVTAPSVPRVAPSPSLVSVKPPEPQKEVPEALLRKVLKDEE